MQGTVIDLSGNGCRICSPISDPTLLNYCALDIRSLIDDQLLFIELAAVRWHEGQDFGAYEC